MGRGYTPVSSLVCPMCVYKCVCVPFLLDSHSPSAESINLGQLLAGSLSQPRPNPPPPHQGILLVLAGAALLLIIHPLPFPTPFFLEVVKKKR